MSDLPSEPAPCVATQLDSSSDEGMAQSDRPSSMANVEGMAKSDRPELSRLRSRSPLSARLLRQVHQRPAEASGWLHKGCLRPRALSRKAAAPPPPPLRQSSSSSASSAKTPVEFPNQDVPDCRATVLPAKASDHKAKPHATLRKDTRYQALRTRILDKAQKAADAAPSKESRMSEQAEPPKAPPKYRYEVWFPSH